MGILDNFLRRETPAFAERVPMNALPPRHAHVRSNNSETAGVSSSPGSNKLRQVQKRIFQAAGTGRLENSWTATPTSVDSWIFQQLTILVARSREQAENSDHAAKFVQLCRDNIAGPAGFTLQANIKDPNGSPDTLASNAIEDAFERFSKRGNFDVTGNLSRGSAERMIASTLPTDGEVFVIARYGPELNEFGFAVQFVDPVLLDPAHYQDLGGGRVIRHGIEFNANGKPVNYWFKRMDERQMGYIKGGGVEYDIVPAENVCHIFLPEKIGQKRGLPWLRTALWRLRMLQGFEDAAIVNARVGASKMGFFRDPNGDPTDCEDLPMEGDPGTFEDIGDRELVQWNPQFPEQSIDAFTKVLLRSIASGLKVSYNNLASDLTSVNFSSIRQGALDEREVWKGLQQLVIDSYSSWLYERWLQRALLSNAIMVANKPLKFERIAKYKAVTWNGRRWSWIDPASEVAANEKAIALKIKSRSEVIRETSNRDPADVWAEISREDQDMKALGVVPALMPGQQDPSQQQKPAPEPAEE